MMDIHEIVKKLPHRYPFLLVDRVLELEKGKRIKAHAAHLVVHGVLHLSGFDHHNEAEASNMEALEVQILARLGFSNPYSGKLYRDKGKAA